MSGGMRPVGQPERGPILGETGSVYVTLAAARAYAQQQGLGIEEARRDLTVFLLRAHRTQEAQGDRPEGWRRRNEARRLDVSARVVHQEGLAVVVSVSVRAQRSRAEQRKRP